MVGFKLKTPYDLEYMAEDVTQLLDELQIKTARILDASMGGMIGQLLAIHYSNRLLSLNAIMSTTGEKHLPRGRISSPWELFKPKPKEQSFE